MAQLRKMLGDISSEECVALMHLIETQSKSTLSKWAIEYARRNYLTVYQRHCADDHTMAGLLAVCRAYAMGEGELKQAKNAIKMMRQRARELGEQPVAQAAAQGGDQCHQYEGENPGIVRPLKRNVQAFDTEDVVNVDADPLQDIFQTESGHTGDEEQHRNGQIGSPGQSELFHSRRLFQLVVGVYVLAFKMPNVFGD